MTVNQILAVTGGVDADLEPEREALRVAGDAVGPYLESGGGFFFSVEPGLGTFETLDRLAAQGLDFDADEAEKALDALGVGVSDAAVARYGPVIQMAYYLGVAMALRVCDGAR